MYDPALFSCVGNTENSGVMSMKIRNTLVPFFLGALIALPLKIYQLLTVVDYTTGFYKSGNFSNVLLPIVIALTIIAIFVTALTSRQFPQYSPKVKSVFLGLVSGVTAIGIGYASAVELFSSGKAMFDGTIGLIYSCLGLISVLSFLFLMVSFFMANNLVSVKPAILLPPVLWTGLRMVLTFFDFSHKANISEISYDILMMAFLLIFLLSTAKFMSGAGENTSKLTFASGASAAFLAMLTSIPRYILRFTNMSRGTTLQLSVETAKTYDPHFPDLMMVFFAIGFLYYISTPVKQVIPARAGARPPYPQQRVPVRQPYPQGAPMMQRPVVPYAQPPMMQRPVQPLPGAGADIYTTRGAGMKIADQFNLNSSVQAAESKYGGLDNFRENMLSGRRALDVLDTSSAAPQNGIYDNFGEENDTPVNKPTFSVHDIAEPAADEGEALSEQVDESLGGLYAQRDNKSKAPKEAEISGASDEAGDYYPEEDERDYPASPPERRSVSLGSGRHNGRLSDRLSAAEEERSRRNRPPQRTPIDDMPYDDRYDMYDDEYDDGYGRPRYRRDEYEYDDYDRRASRRRGYYDDDYDSDYDTDYDDEYEDEYDDEYDDDYDDEYDDYDDYDDDGYDDEGGYYGGY